MQRQLGFFQVRQHGRARAIKRRARIGQGQAPGGAIEQAHPKPAFQPGNGLADRRGRQVQAFSGGPEAARVGDTDKNIDAFYLIR